MELYSQVEYENHDFAAKKWERLALHAEHGVKGTGAIVEALRRVDASTGELMKISNTLSAHANRLGLAMLILAAVQVGLAAIQIWLAFSVR